MRVFVNLPELETDKKELEKRVAQFHATLLVKKIKSLKINDSSKEKVLKLVLEQLKERGDKEKCISG